MSKNRDQMSELFRRYSDEIRRYLAKRLRSADDAEDLMQETFFRVQRHDPQGKIEHVRAYLYRIARNLAIDAQRRSSSGIIDREAVVDELEHMHPSPSPEEAASIRQEYRALCDAVVNLSPQVRRTIVLSKFHQMSYKEIAAVMQISVRTVENHIARGISQCRKQLVHREADSADNVVALRAVKTSTETQ